MTMPIQVYPGNGVEFDLNEKSATQRDPWRVNGVYDEVTAALLVLAAAPVWQRGMVRQSARAKEQAPGIWEVLVTYGDEDEEKSKQKPEPGVWEYSFETGQAQHKVTQSRKVISSHSYSESVHVPDVLGAIGVDDKGVNGVEVLVPDPRFSVTAYFDPRQVTTELFFNLERVAFHANSAPFLGAQPYELLFLGAEGRGELPTVAGQRVKPVPIRFSFAFSRTLRDLKVGSMTIPLKRGWDYLDIRYGAFPGEEETAVVRRPLFAYVHEMYPPLDFGAAFGIRKRNRLR